jgi:hypothetical protein
VAEGKSFKLARMEPRVSKLGIAERLAVVGLVAGVAGVAVSIAFPPAYPESLLSIDGWKIVFWISITILSISVLFGLSDIAVHVALRRGVELGTVLVLIGTIFIAIGIIIGLIGAFKMDNSSTRAEEDISSVLDRTIKVTCEYSSLPTIAPADKIVELELSHPDLPKGGGYIRYNFQQPGAPIEKLGIGDAPNYAYLCTFSNFGAAAVLNIEADFNIEFQEAITIENGFKPGSTIYSSSITTPKMNLTSNGGTFSFYIRNYSPSAFAVVRVPVTARGQKVGAESAEGFKLASAVWLRFWLPPFPPKQAVPGV